MEADMVSDARHFARLFRVELDDLIQEIQLRVDLNEKRFQCDEITEYVHLENCAVLRREIDALKKFTEIVDGIDPSNYKDTAGIEADMIAKSKDFVSRLEDPAAVSVLLQGKIEKVRSFISSGDSLPTPR
jgi:hypothetical protein